jgi:ATP-binding cassette subfamily B protein
LFLLALGAHLDRRRLARATTLVLAGYVAVPFSALALAAFTNDALRHTSGGQVVPSRPGAAATMAVVVAVLLIAQLMCGHFAHLDYFELSEMQQSHLEGELMGMLNLPPTIDHLDNPAFADDLQLVREGLFKSTKSLEACINMSGLLLQTVLTAVILIRLNPWLALLPVMALPPVWAGNRAQAVLERAREQAAEALRLNRHLVELSTSAASVKELRLFATEGDVLERQEAAWDKVTSVMWRGQARSAALRAGGQAFFALAYGGAVLAVLYQAGRGHSNLGGWCRTG